MLRLVFGLGTRATGRVAGDYPRIVSLDQPSVVPFGGEESNRRFSQRQIDLLNIEDNVCQTMPLADLLAEGIPLPEIYSRFGTTVQRRGGGGIEKGLSFDRLLAEGSFASLMTRMLSTLERSYDYPVDVEFTATSSYSGRLRINLVQCRPLQTKGVQVQRVDIPRRIDETELLFRSRGHFLGGSVVLPIRRVIYVSAGAYLALPLSDRYELARIIGRLNRLLPSREELPTLLMTPGRLGTTTPEMGLPVRFAEIDSMSALVEVSFTEGSLAPDLSFGSHFFQDLVESGIFYAALYPEGKGCSFNMPFLSSRPNLFPDLLPDNARFCDAIRVIDIDSLVLMSDIVSQDLICCTYT